MKKIIKEVLVHPRFFKDLKELGIKVDNILKFEGESLKTFREDFKKALKEETDYNLEFSEDGKILNEDFIANSYENIFMEFCNSKNVIVNYDFTSSTKCDGCVIYNNKIIMEEQPDILSLREALLQDIIDVFKGNTENLKMLNLDDFNKF